MAVLLLSSTLIEGQQAASAEKIRRQKYPELVAIVDLAQASPPELRSLALTRIASQPVLKDEKWQKQLLEEAFEAGALAKIPSRVLVVPLPEGPVTALPARIQRSSVFNAGLDRLTLQSHAIDAMAPLDVVEALRMFQNLPPPDSEATSCSADFVPNFSDYFTTAGSLAPRLLSAADEESETKVAEFLGSVIARATLPQDAAPLLELMSELQVSGNERLQLINSASAALTNMADDSRAWAVTLDWVTASMTKLLAQSTVAERAALLRAWRAYLVNEFAGPQCQEVLDPKWHYSKARQNAIAAFNKQLSDSGIRSVEQIQPDDMHPGTVEGGLADAQHTDSPPLQALHREWFRLEFGDGSGALSDARKQTPEWQDRFSDYLDKIDTLSSDDIGKGEDLFWTKGELMAAAAALPSAGPLRDSAIKRFLGVLAISTVPLESISDWYQLVNSWISLCRSIGGFSKEKTLSVLESSGQPLLMLIADLNRLTR